jgi:hypothetical protein
MRNADVIEVAVFWVSAPCIVVVGCNTPPCPYSLYVHFSFSTHINTEDGCSRVLRNVGIQPLHYTAQQGKRRLVPSPPLKHQIMDTDLFVIKKAPAGATPVTLQAA